MEPILIIYAVGAMVSSSAMSFYIGTLGKKHYSTDDFSTALLCGLIWPITLFTYVPYKIARPILDYRKRRQLHAYEKARQEALDLKEIDRILEQHK